MLIILILWIPTQTRHKHIRLGILVILGIFLCIQAATRIYIGVILPVIIAFVFTGFLILKEDHSYSSPIASLFYEYYQNIDELTLKLEIENDLIQCVVGNQAIKNIVPFGETQKPQLWDYADGVDTLDFLQRI